MDEKRKLAQKNAFLPCISYKNIIGQKNAKVDSGDVSEQKPISHDDHSDIQCKCDESSSILNTTNKLCFNNKKTVLDFILSYYGKLLANITTQIVVVAFTIFLLVVSIYGNTQLREDFDPHIFLPHNSSVKTWLKLHQSAFPSKGELVTIFFEGPPGEEAGSLKNMNFTKLDWLSNELKRQSDVVTKVDFWYSEYSDYYQKNFQVVNANRSSLQDVDLDTLNRTLVQFLFSRNGLKYQYLFNFKEDLECGGVLPHIQVHILFLTHVVIENSLKGKSVSN